MSTTPGSTKHLTDTAQLWIDRHTKSVLVLCVMFIIAILILIYLSYRLYNCGTNTATSSGTSKFKTGRYVIEPTRNNGGSWPSTKARATAQPARQAQRPAPAPRPAPASRPAHVQSSHAGASSHWSDEAAAEIQTLDALGAMPHPEPEFGASIEAALQQHLSDNPLVPASVTAAKSPSTAMPVTSSFHSSPYDF